MIPRLGAVVLASVVGLFGCGPRPISRTEFLSRGNAICTATTARIARLAVPRPTPGRPPEALAGYVDAYVAELRQEVADLRLIGYPAGQRRSLSGAYDALDAALAVVERDPLKFRPASLEPPVARLWQAGLTACRP